MTQITNDIEFKHAIDALDYNSQRMLAGRFVSNVLDLSTDERLEWIVKAALDSNASADELAKALQTARAATIDSHARCGSEGDWQEQAGYFVARAATAAVTPESQSRSGGPAWQAAMSCRMAQTSMLIYNENNATSPESEEQYRILAEFLNA